MITTHPSSMTPGRVWLSPLKLAVPLGIITIGYLLATFISASSEARSSADVNATFPRTLWGLPILEGFRSEGRFGVHLQSGTIVIAVLPVVLTLLLWVAWGRKTRS